MVEDCCVREYKNREENKKLKGDKMNKKTLLWIVIVILALAFLYITFFKGSGTGQAVSAAQSAGQAARSYGGMVGGC